MGGWRRASIRCFRSTSRAIRSSGVGRVLRLVRLAASRRIGERSPVAEGGLGEEGNGYRFKETTDAQRILIRGIKWQHERNTKRFNSIWPQLCGAVTGQAGSYPHPQLPLETESWSGKEPPESLSNHQVLLSVINGVLRSEELLTRLAAREAEENILHSSNSRGHQTKR